MAGKLIVHVLDASDLTPKKASQATFVQVEFQDQRQRTSIKLGDLNPCWNEKLVFQIDDFEAFINQKIDFYVYNDNSQQNRRNSFLGRVRISGFTVPLSENEASVQRYPLDKKGIFPNVRGDIALKLYVGNGDVSDHGSEEKTKKPERVSVQDPIDLIQELEEGLFDHKEISPDDEDKSEKKNEKKKKTVKTSYSVAAEKSEKKSDLKAEAAPPPARVMQMMQYPPMQHPHEYSVIETRPPLAARTGYLGRDKIARTYDLVEQMGFLFVHVVKAKNLPEIDPYVEVKVGNYKALTKHFEKNQNPVWNNKFAFPRERLQSNLIEISVKTKDEIVGKVLFDVSEVPKRVPPDGPLAPHWHRLQGPRGGRVGESELMVAVWMGTQADEAFPESWHSDAHSITQQSLANTRSKVYFSPKLYYLRAHIIAAQDVIPSSNSRVFDTFVRVKLGHQERTTRPSPSKTINPEWKEELMFVASEPFDEYLIISVEESVGPNKDEVLGRFIFPVREIPHRFDESKLPDPRWFPLFKPSAAEEGEEKPKQVRFASRILVGMCIDSSYHVLDEYTPFSSDFQPSSKHLRKPSIGILEVGILGARNLLPMKTNEGKLTDAYCVAKYGNKWVRTRTLLSTLHPRWNEQYTWEVHDPCTVLTIGVFDNCHGNHRDERIGKVRVRLSTLETDRVYTHSYPLLILSPFGLRKHGELHLAIRFRCTAWMNMVMHYGKPLLPKMHYIQPLSRKNILWLRYQAMHVVAMKLSRAEPPLRIEVIEYMLDVDYNTFSLRRSKANFQRILLLLSGISYIYGWFDDICKWKNPITTILVHLLFLILVCYPELILSTIFLYLFIIGLWNYRFRPRTPPHMNARLSQAENVHPDELDEEFDSYPSSRIPDLVQLRYHRLKSVAGKVQTVMGDIAMQGERATSLLSWRDPRATAILVFFSLVWAVVVYVTPIQAVAVVIGLYTLRHPDFGRMPSVPVNFFKRLPGKSDSLL